MLFFRLYFFITGFAAQAGESLPSAEQARHWFIREGMTSRIVSALAIVVTIGILRGVVVRRIRENERIDPEDRRRWIVNTRNAALLLMLLAVFIIWADRIQAFAASIVVIAAAIVIATKELILCLSGSLVRAMSRSFDIGDRIEINGVRGDVIDRTALSTKILEIGPGQSSHQHTGRAVTIPNSVLVSSPVINETFTEDYVLHVFSIPITLDQDWKRAEEVLLRVAKEECAPLIESARRHIVDLLDQHGLEAPNVEPRVSITVPEPGKIVLLARIPAPARKKGRMEQSIIRRFLEEFYNDSQRPSGETSK